MNYNEIDEFIETLAKLNVFLVRLKHEQAELSKTRTIQTVKPSLDGFSFPDFEQFDSQRRRAILEDLQSNKKSFEDDAEATEGIKKINEKEIDTMSSRLLIIQNKRCRLRQHVSGKNTLTYEIRYRREGYNISASGQTIELAKQAFIKKFKVAKAKKTGMIEIPEAFSSFALFYFENFRKERVALATFRADLNRFNNYLQPCFKETRLESITPFHCKKLLDQVSESGKKKTADELFSLMNCIFKSAIAHSVLQRNPLATVLHVQHERVSGSALTKEEENVLKNCKSKYLPAFMMALYTGARPNELYTANTQGNFIVMQNSKQKTKKIRYKKIPILNQLKPYLTEELKLPAYEELRKEFKKILPNHKIYDLRTTFYTRCVEFLVDETARKLFMGHSLGKIPGAYTDVSDEFLIRESKKLDKW